MHEDKHRVGFHDIPKEDWERIFGKKCEPDYSAQCRRSELGFTPYWIIERTKEAKADGCTACRVSESQEYDLLLFEGWKEQPETYPEPFYHLTTVEPVKTPVSRRDSFSGRGERWV